MEFYMEKVHIYEKNILKEILLVIYKNRLNFLYLEKEIFFMRPISIIESIDSIIKCTMTKSFSKDKNESLQKPFQFLSIKLIPQIIKEEKRSHIIIIQHQKSLKDSNF